MAKSKQSATPAVPEQPDATADPGTPNSDAVVVSEPAFVPAPSPLHVPVAVALWACGTLRQPTLVVAASDAGVARQRYADLLGVTWFGNPVSVEPAPAEAMPSDWPPKE